MKLMLEGVVLARIFMGREGVTLSVRPIARQEARTLVGERPDVAVGRFEYGKAQVLEALGISAAPDQIVRLGDRFLVAERFGPRTQFYVVHIVSDADGCVPEEDFP
jgi:hypothetical protein